MDDSVPDGETYLNICDTIKAEINTEKYGFSSLSEFSQHAWEKDKAEKDRERKSNSKKAAPSSDTENVIAKSTKSKAQPIMSKNVILYGPPGTGKTYNTVRKAVEIIKGEDLSNEKYEAVKVEYDTLKNNGRINFVTFHQSYGYEEFIEGIKPVTKGGVVKYEVMDGIFKEFCERAGDDKTNKYVFIIDEINRGNISKIFGELITLIEDNKREGASEAMSVKLPYSQKSFSVPDNVYIIGTMNTADRSITAIDTALRRRFTFEEMMPEYTALKNSDDTEIIVKDINIAKMLAKMNERIAVLYDREHTIGHAYFMPLKDNSSFELLSDIFRNKIIPLLQEYFYEDYGKIHLVLGDNQKANDMQFIVEGEIKYFELFGPTEEYNFGERNKKYLINKNAFDKPQAYIGIYMPNNGYSDSEK